MGEAIDRLIDLSRHPAKASQLRRGDKIVLSGQPVKVVKVVKDAAVSVWGENLSTGKDVLVNLSQEDPVENLSLSTVHAHLRHLKTGKVVSVPEYERHDVRERAADLLRSARMVEPQVTREMQDLAAKHGTTLAGLDFRMKSQASLERKIRMDMKNERLPLDAAARKISDVVRYTHMTDTAHYNAATRNILRELEAKGYQLKTKNFWVPGDDYQGINVKMTSPQGHQIEVQFHTPESFHAKETLNHPLYERFRVSENGAERRLLWRQMVENASRVPIPPGIRGLPTETVKPYVDEPGLSAV